MERLLLVYGFPAAYIALLVAILWAVNRIAAAVEQLVEDSAAHGSRLDAQGNQLFTIFMHVKPKKRPLVPQESGPYRVAPAEAHDVDLTDTDEDEVDFRDPGLVHRIPTREVNMSEVHGFREPEKPTIPFSLDELEEAKRASFPSQPPTARPPPFTPRGR